MKRAAAAAAVSATRDRVLTERLAAAAVTARTEITPSIDETIKPALESAERRTARETCIYFTWAAAAVAAATITLLTIIRWAAKAATEAAPFISTQGIR